MINFLKYRTLYLAISLIVILAGLFSMIRWGYVLSIDFVGGTQIDYQTQAKLDTNKVREILRAQKIEPISVETTANQLSLRLKAIDQATENKMQTALQSQLKTPLTVLRSETVGPTLGAEMMRKTGIAAVLAILGILIYMSFAFKGWTFALAAIIALLHDVLVLVGTYSLLSHFFGAQVDTLFVTALLTTMSFSVHDTIVIFDKIREYMRSEARSNIEYFANKALTETLVRSVNNSMTIIFMLLALILLGGSTIKFFVIALLIGTITGTYSSPFVATPVLVWLEKRKK